MGTTSNLGLTLTPASDTTTTFKEWRTAMNGETSDSNMSKIDAAVGNINSKIAAILPYVVCTTSGSTYSKSASATGFALTTGARVSVKFSYAHTSSTAATLNINSTGAKTIYAYNGSDYANVTSSFSWKANEIVEMIYDGNYWIVTAASMDFAPRHNIDGGTF